MLAIVMVAGYLGLLPLLQSLAAEPAWPDSPGTASARISEPFSMPPVVDSTYAANRSQPMKISHHHHHSQRVSRPAPATTARPSTTGRAAPRIQVQLPGNLSGGDVQPTDDSASQSTGG